ncbi:MAG: hypothetical protein HYV07_15655 [Deltaproteobacteria bacterium]|nr:hypothetical protein [Deltaproteobacteria bacterium]
MRFALGVLVAFVAGTTPARAQGPRPPPGSNLWKLTKGGQSSGTSAGATTRGRSSLAPDDDDGLDEAPISGHAYVLWRVATDPLSVIAGRTCVLRTRVPVEPTCGIADCLEEGESHLEWSVSFPKAGKTVDSRVCSSTWKDVSAELAGPDLVLKGSRRAKGAPEGEPLLEVIKGVKIFSNGKDAALTGNVTGTARCSPFAPKKSRILIACRLGETSKPALDRWVPLVDAGGGRAEAEKIGGHAAVALARMLRRPSREIFVLGDSLDSKRPGVELFYSDAGLEAQVDEIGSRIQTAVSGVVVRRRLVEKLGGDELLLSVGSERAR